MQMFKMEPLITVELSKYKNWIWPGYNWDKVKFDLLNHPTLTSLFRIEELRLMVSELGQNTSSDESIILERNFIPIISIGLGKNPIRRNFQF